MINPEAPVLEPRDFFGREPIVKRLFSRIGADRPQSIAVIGGKKSGKTSLLNYIFNDEVRRKYLANPDSYIFTLVRSDQSSHSASSILELVADTAFGNEPDSNPYSALQKLVESHHGAGKKLIVLFDDFHLVTGNKDFPLEFFSFLRSLANNYNVAYVTTSYLELQQLCVVKAIEESPFFNIFTNLTLGLFTPGEGAGLLTGILALDKAMADSIVGLCGPHPYILKSVASLIAANTITASDAANSFEKSVLPHLVPYFGKIVSLLPKDAYNALRAAEKNGKPDVKELHHLRPLIRHGFLVENDDRVEPFSAAFGLFIKKHCTQTMLRGGDGYVKGASIN
jgi:hypothetical protein